jgi:hypothetical protein
MSDPTLVLTIQPGFYQNFIEEKKEGICRTYLCDKSIQRKCCIAAEHLDDHTVSSNNSYNLQLSKRLDNIKGHTQKKEKEIRPHNKSRDEIWNALHNARVKAICSLHLSQSLKLHLNNYNLVKLNSSNCYIFYHFLIYGLSSVIVKYSPCLELICLDYTLLGVEWM